MPITYEVRDDGRFVHTKAVGEVTEEDLVNYRAAMLSDVRVTLGFDELFDGTAANWAGLSEAVIERMMEVDRRHTEKLKGGKCAIVIRTGFDLAERFERSHSGPHHVMLFFNLDVAQTWLGERAEGTLSG
jgi:hypothetical protein